MDTARNTASVILNAYGTVLKQSNGDGIASARKRLIDGLQYKEIAEETGLELNTVRTRIRRAKAMIEKMKSE